MLHDGTTELEKKMYLAEDPADCSLASTKFGTKGDESLSISVVGVADAKECQQVSFQLFKQHSIINIHTSTSEQVSIFENWE